MHNLTVGGMLPAFPYTTACKCWQHAAIVVYISDSAKVVPQMSRQSSDPTYMVPGLNYTASDADVRSLSLFRIRPAAATSRYLTGEALVLTSIMRLRKVGVENLLTKLFPKIGGEPVKVELSAIHRSAGGADHQNDYVDRRGASRHLYTCILNR